MKRQLPSVSHNNVGGLSIFMSAVITQLSAESLKHFFPPLPQISLAQLVFLDPAVLSVIDVFFFFFFFEP